jgi:copper chaperone CopZ
VFGKRTLWLYLLSIIVGAMLFGLGIDYLLPQEWFAVQSGILETACHDEGISIFSYICTALLIVFLLNALLHSHHHHHHHHGEEAEEMSSYIIYNVEGMNCSHCAENVQRAIAAVEGVEQVSVSLHEGTACVVGSPSDPDILLAVESIGFRAERRVAD